MCGSHEYQGISRRQMVGLLAAAGLAGCTPARILLQAYPEPFKQDDALNERILGAFADTIIPGAGDPDRNVLQVYRDEFYPFAKYHKYFASDLCRRAGRLCDTDHFDRLPRKTGSAWSRTRSRAMRLHENSIRGPSCSRRWPSMPGFMTTVAAAQTSASRVSTSFAGWMHSPTPTQKGSLRPP